MRRQKLTGYTPNYPKKLLKGAALTAATLLAIGGTACELRTEGEPPLPDDMTTDGTVATDTPFVRTDAPIPDESPEPALAGEPMADEGEDLESVTRGEVALPGKILIPEETEQP